MKTLLERAAGHPCFQNVLHWTYEAQSQEGLLFDHLD